MSVKRRDLIRYFEKNGFYMLREGGNHTIIIPTTILNVLLASSRLRLLLCDK